MSSPQDLIQRLQEALHETQQDLAVAQQQLRSVPWLVGALRYIADDECPYAQPPPDTDDDPHLECACPVCTAKGALVRYEALRPVPGRP